MVRTINQVKGYGLRKTFNSDMDGRNEYRIKTFALMRHLKSVFVFKRDLRSQDV